MDKYRLNHVVYLPKQLEEGTLYVSKEYSVAGHLCACGCGNKIITPLGPTEWKLSERKGKATLKPSIGNWQLPCTSHYWIIDGEVEWSYKWTEQQILAGAEAEENIRKNYYEGQVTKQPNFFKLGQWVRKVFSFFK